MIISETAWQFWAQTMVEWSLHLCLVHEGRPLSELCPMTPAALCTTSYVFTLKPTETSHKRCDCVYIYYVLYSVIEISGNTKGQKKNRLFESVLYDYNAPGSHLF